MTEPLLLSIKQASNMLGVSYWTVRDYVLSGVLRRANLPGTNGKGKLGKILIARTEIDRLIAKATETRDAERRPRLPKGQNMVDKILSERAGSLRVIKKQEA